VQVNLRSDIIKVTEANFRNKIEGVDISGYL
jgi:hypothetical protein